MKKVNSDLKELNIGTNWGRALCRNPAKPVETDLPWRNRAKNRAYYTVWSAKICLLISCIVYFNMSQFRKCDIFFYSVGLSCAQPLVTGDSQPSMYAAYSHNRYRAYYSADRNIDPTLIWCWFTVYDTGPTSIQHLCNYGLIITYVDLHVIIVRFLVKASCWNH